MTIAVAPWLIAGLGLVVAIPVARWLRWVTYRKPDEEEMPIPGSRWWVVPILAISWWVLAWRVLVADPAQPGGSDPGADSPHARLIQAIVLVTLLVVALASVCLAAMDFDVHRLPDRLMWPSMGVLLVGLSIAGVVATEWGAILRVVLAGLACGGGYLLLALLSLARGSLAVGLGDVKLAALLGMGLGWFGWQTVLIGMYAGFLAGGVFALVLLLTRRVGRDGDLAYGPPMMVGAVLALLTSPGALSSLF
ncbi:prepilin peptidase [Ornithinimicrobium cryptoxanthini]|uniref:A24 family peptidase n=1 Tax=Ornithinimicrobium cryptoxanthini TaxID=2934161 RepID=A0ABY4YEG7_9MICO|nr:A24 family peptidase [Ornithinimicrobium cryptoxanthini]USQ74987.1 A24 family peptidase [Ornithinimicrobium cryptoxanthini]